jgi:siroheme synthase (precorrin-2 oxidase/ferrochelatase)
MEQDNYCPEKILAFAIRRDITNLFKDFLVILENLEDDHDEALNKLVRTLPPESQKQLFLADHFTDEKMEQIRKRILSKGNDSIRSLEREIDHYKINFK